MFTSNAAESIFSLQVDFIQNAVSKENYNKMEVKKYKLVFVTEKVERNLSVAISNWVVDCTSKNNNKVLFLYSNQTSMVRGSHNYYSCLFSESINSRIIFMSHFI